MFRFLFHRFAIAVALSAPFAAFLHTEDFQGAGHKLEYEAPPILYHEQAPNDAVAQLQRRLAAGDAKLGFDERFGYLPALLDELKIPRSSQSLVFSKTSLQRTFINPENPRALYFNDDVYIGFIPGAPALEISAVDPKLGAVFYRLENEKVRRPRFTRDQDCLRCHGAQRTLGVPGFFVRSIGTDENGELDTQSEVNDIDHCTPFADRWAGWFVTGKHGTQHHRGNLIGPAALARAEVAPNEQGNLEELSRFFDVTRHLRPTSDIVALLVLEHQAKMHNYITRLNYETQQMLNMYGHTRYLSSQVNAFLRFLLFTEETPLTASIQGDAAYLADFAVLALRDSKGRSLRDFDLQTRIFKYPCSYLIYSPAFDAMPEPMREQLLARLYDVLVGKDPDPQFARLAPPDRKAILEILRETKPNLPDYWRKS